MSQPKHLPRATEITRNDLLAGENQRLRGKVESQRAQLNELRRKLTESEERNAHSNAMLRRTTRLLDEVVYSKQQSSELIEEVEQMRMATTEAKGFESRCLIVGPNKESDGGEL